VRPSAPACLLQGKSQVRISVKHQKYKNNRMRKGTEKNENKQKSKNQAVKLKNKEMMQWKKKKNRQLPSES
jgi:hypothetical protein